MRLQGITGPSYRFLHGSNNEILNMKSEAKNRPMGLSHDMMSKVQPHIHSWVNKYGNQKEKTSNYVYFTKLDRFSFSYIPPPLSLSSVQGRFIFNGMALNLNWSLQNHSLSKRCWITEAELIRRKSLRAIWRGSLEMGFQYLKVKNGQRWRNRPLKPSMPRAWKWSLIGFEKHV